MKVGSFACRALLFLANFSDSYLTISLHTRDRLDPLVMLVSSASHARLQNRPNISLCS